ETVSATASARRLRGRSLAAGAVTGDGAQERAGEDERDRRREQPPGVDAPVRQYRRQTERDRDAGRDPPVVADDEVPPETAERAQTAHAPASAGTSRCRRRNAWTQAKETNPKNASTPRIESSSPGQSTPTPSAAQKQPNVVRSRPTVNLIVFSGT